MPVSSDATLAKSDASPPLDRAEMESKARAAHLDPSSSAHQNYNRILSPSVFSAYGWKRRGMRLNLGGNFRIYPRKNPNDATRFEQRLDLHNAAVQTRCRWKEGEVRLRSFVAHGSRTLVIEVECTKPGLIERLTMSRIPSPFGTAPRSGTDGPDFWLADSFKPADPRLSPHIEAAVAGRVAGFRPRIHDGDREIEISLPRTVRRFTVLLTIAVEEQNSDVVAAARKMIAGAHDLGAWSLCKQHERHWHAFWEKSQVELADKFLEKLWYVNLYALACCDGTGTRWKAQATGLNGLWDIKNPDGWGSCWYWDVNIEEAYWGCYTANHLEMAQPFYEGLREYVPAARRRAREYYKMRGIAPDFPHPFYHCMWPWCCQFLWWGYRYAMDEQFLREVAYPIMREVLEFFEDFLQRDARGRYNAFPTVSPEQGPLTKNATILLATLRYLLKAAIEASRLLHADVKSRKKWREILDNLADFPKGESAQFGKTFKDSEWATPTLGLAHPSVLMPIYPTALIGPGSPKELREIARNTLTYAETLQALGTFNFGWLSACASRLGLGDEAARLIYEKGIAYLLRPNGLMAEESDRFVHNCHVLSDPLYLPPMSECSGGMLGAINEMLLQSRDGKVRVFPAVPSEWLHARFNSLLAEGALEVSAQWFKGKTIWVRVKSLKGGSYRLVFNGRETQIALRPGEKMSFGKARTVRVVAGNNCYITPTQRRVFLGKEAKTEYLRKLDDFLFDYNVGDIPVPKQTKYKFDFGRPSSVPRKYARVIPQQLFNKGKLGADFYRVHPDTVFTELLRYGWEKDFHLRATDRRQPDDLRRDFVGGMKPATFCIELPRGQYQLLFLIGDLASETVMSIEVREQFRWHTRPPLRVGQFAVEVFPVRLTDDGLLRILFAGKRWHLNALMVNRVP
jgi:hypothetical protein